MTKDTEVAAAVAKLSPQMLKSEPPSTVCLMHTMSSRAKLSRDRKDRFRWTATRWCVGRLTALHVHRSPATVEGEVLPQCVLAFVSLMTLAGYGSH